eukprot:SAG11_NODE_2541_length_3241_cov_4.313495_3_plen_105_part_00
MLCKTSEYHASPKYPLCKEQEWTNDHTQHDKALRCIARKKATSGHRYEWSSRPLALTGSRSSIVANLWCGITVIRPETCEARYTCAVAALCTLRDLHSASTTIL